MAHHYAENFFTKAFTPREYQVELLATAKENNIIVCLGNGSNKVFITLKLIQELANAVRRPYRRGGKRTVLLTSSVSSFAQHALSIKHLTDLRVGEYYESGQLLDLKNDQVLIMTSDMALEFILHDKLKLSDMNLLIVDDCHLAIRDHSMQQVMEALWRRGGDTARLRVLGLTWPLVPGPSGAEPGRLEAEIQRLEATLRCSADTASDIVSTLRYCAKPKEVILECGKYSGSELNSHLEEQFLFTKEFLDDHRYDPSEIYDEEYMEDLVNIPDPKEDPNTILGDFHHVLSTMGPWCADKAALVLLIHIEKLKVKTPYERHFLLLCMVSSVMLKIRAACDSSLQGLEEKDKIKKYSSPKVLRLLEALRNFKPKSQPCNLKEIENGKKEAVKGGEGNSALANGFEINGMPFVNNTDEIDQPCESNIELNEEKLSVDIDLSPDQSDSIFDYEIKEKLQTPSEDDHFKLSNKVKTHDGHEPATVKKVCTSSKRERVISEIKHVVVNNHVHVSATNTGCQLVNINEDPATVEKVQQVPNSTDLFSCDVKKLTNGTGVYYSTDTLQCEKVENLVNDSDIDKLDNNHCNEHTKLCNTNDHDQEVCNSLLNSTLLNGISHIRNDSLDSAALPLQDYSENKATTTGDKTNNSRNGQEDCDGIGRGGRLRGRGRGWRFQKKNFISPRNKVGSQEDMEALCAIIFVENPFTAKILFHLLNELRRCDPDFAFISPQYTVSKVANPITEPREAEVEHRKQEEVLKRFRIRECNVLISTSILEEGIDLPKCNLVIRYDVPSHYRSYAQSKGRARAQDSHFLIMVEQHNTANFISNFAQFIEIERMLLARCTNREPTEIEESEADNFNSCVPSFSPGPVPVSMSSAIALVNRYCAKLPSDTFTRLTPLWSVQPINYLGQPMYYCTVRLPINSPVKQDIIGHPMPSRVLARRVAALETCRVLHAARELDDSLLPVGKESLTVSEEDEEDCEKDKVSSDPLEPRPGTTKRRQYYYKRIASALSDCRPVEGRPCQLYSLQMVLTCPLPEEQNTRGRKLHPPEDSPQGFGILTTKTMPKICPFPIFTRSGEVRVSLELRQVDLVLTEVQLMMISTFLNYTFTSVLRLQKYLMLFDPNATENSYLVVPTKNGGDKILVDWEFLELIYSRRQEPLHVIPDKSRENFAFEPDKYHDAVVMPWYRNQDQPQYFYVAEICSHLNPKSSFPGSDYQTFEEYYQKKYGISIQNCQQPLLDVDHTSARLNFLTPRYVNRKGVALPTSSEETKRAKRENLEQKQILVPELCMIHPFPASLWRQAVCLPCILYRTNALLLADEIRTTVARDLHLGLLSLPQDFEWGPLDFGWSLADVLKKSKEENEKNVTALKVKPGLKPIEEYEEILNKVIKKEVDEKSDDSKKQQDEQDESWMEIGTWSNEMAGFETDSNSNTNMVVRYGSPTSWQHGGATGEDGGMELCLYDSDVESDLSSEQALSSGRSSPQRGLRITFTGDYLAEAEDDNYESDTDSKETVDWQWQDNNALDIQQDIEREMKKFDQATKELIEVIKSSRVLVRSDMPLVISREAAKDPSTSIVNEAELGFQPTGYGMPSEMISQLILSNYCSPSADSALDSDSEVSIEESLSSFSDNDEESTLLSFDEQPDLESHPGPSPSLLLQALTMSNANDGINLERLETIGDSFLKYAITTYLYCAHETVHEGKLSHLRSKQVSNLNLYRLGKKKLFGESMIATKFEPHDNWLPPCYQVPRELERALVEAGLPACLWSQAEIPVLCDMTRDQMVASLQERAAASGNVDAPLDDSPCFVPYNLITQHSIPDKSIADCVEALIGAYLIACGPRGALLFMSWLGIRVLPHKEVTAPVDTRPVGSILMNEQKNGQLRYGALPPPKSPLLHHVPDPESELARLLDGFDVFERRLSYRFRDRSYLLQAMTHASYSPNRLTDCYQRLEFLGDAVLDYLITRHLYEDKRQHCPGALTDLRSALVNNTIFASLAVRHGFHKFFRHLSPGLAEVVERFVRIQEENGHAISEEYYLIGEDECEEAEDVEVPKALGDVFESVAGAIFLDSEMSLDSVWKAYYRMMKTEIEQFSTNVPKSPIRELLELEPETAKFGKPEKLADGRRVRVTVEVFGKGAFKGIGRNYRIAKCTAAKCALKQLKKRGLLAKKLNSAQPCIATNEKRCGCYWSW